MSHPWALNFWRWMVALLALAPFAIPKLSLQLSPLASGQKLSTADAIGGC